MSDQELKEVYKTINSLAREIILKVNVSEVAEIASSHANAEKRLKISKFSSIIAERFVDLEQGLLANHVYTEDEAQIEIRELEQELERKEALEKKIEQCSKRWSDMLDGKDD